ncbi:hypothetical protein C8R43DRAFT_956835 [Mycena crocata]|nr:hypothetical protein C8R43DRAFT_956835 [Mycena crocata]
MAPQPATADPPPDNPDLPTSGDAVWLPADCVALLEFLVTQRAAMADNGHFKPVVYRAAAVKLEAIRAKGGPKTFKSCQQKYGWLRKLCELVEIIKGVSGWHYNDETGVSVTPATESSWDDWVKVFPMGSRFALTGFPYYYIMEPLMPQKAKGSNVFRAGADETPLSPAANRSVSPDWDQEQMNNEFGEKSTDSGQNPAGDDDDDGDPDDINSSSPATLTSTRKRVAAQSSSGYHKKPRLGPGTQGLIDIASAAVDFNEIFSSFRGAFAATDGAPQTSASTSTAPAPAPVFQLSPQRRITAIVQAQKESWLSNSDRVALIKILRDVTKADVYTALETDEIRIPWILSELEEVGVITFHPTYSGFDF